MFSAISANSEDRRIIDCHVHVTRDGKWHDTHHHASISRLLDEMASSPVDGAALLPVGKTEAEIRAATEFVVELVDKYPKIFIGFHGYYPGFDLEKACDNRLKGIKIHPRMNRLDIFGSGLARLFEQADDHNMPVLIDAYCTPISDVAPDRLRPHNFWKLAEKYPDLTIIMGHCGLPFIWEAYPPLKWHPNLYADISHILNYFRHTSLIQDLGWILNKIPHKIFYGSDFPEVGFKNYYEDFITFCKAHGVSPEAVLYNFFDLLFGGQPAKDNVPTG